MRDKVRDGLRWVVADRRTEKYIFTTFKSSEENTVNPLLSPPRGLFISNTFQGGGLIETGGLIESAALLNLAKTMVSVIHKKTRIQSGKAQVQEVGGPAAEDQKQYELPVGE